MTGRTSSRSEFGVGRTNAQFRAVITVDAVFPHLFLRPTIERPDVSHSLLKV
jgi:hypothetical protein